MYAAACVLAATIMGVVTGIVPWGEANYDSRYAKPIEWDDSA